ncbi:dienelactone hydrolase family protein [Halopseudomonas maritima]|uniref:dienelactone hydrolase family protein n=1 Tax=Halopseudomonas maritima TaxID=2918528 RepID=UPI001EEC71D4|nr:dienelactone hydrolase family protein [Halopseudomonas maritima]UJJ31729.1 dienelactone hydrolase family protein [Halopseudomonas maritima]
MKHILGGVVISTLAGLVQAQIKVEQVDYEIDGKAFEGRLVYDASVQAPRAGVLMVPNWMGVTDAAVEKASKVAGSDYVVFVVDMYGRDIRPANAEEAGAAASTVRDDRALMRTRVNAGLELLASQTRAPVASDQLVAIGFCFGGGSVLELARSGAELKGVVSFHGNLDTPNPADATNIKTPILVLHGADDPFVPDQQVADFQAEMRGAGVDWQLISYGGAVHSFSDPYASMPGKAEYHPVVAKRSIAAMQQFFDEVLSTEE